MISIHYRVLYDAVSLNKITVLSLAKMK